MPYLYTARITIPAKASKEHHEGAVCKVVKYFFPTIQ